MTAFPSSSDPLFAPLRGAQVLVTGATGFTGSVLVRHLTAAGARVRAIARPSSRVEALADLDIEWVRGQVYDRSTVRTAAAGVHYVFHLAAALREARSSEDIYRRVHCTSTRLLAEAAAQTPGFKRFVHVSTIGVHGHITHPPANETAPFHPDDGYQRTKAEAEQWFRTYASMRGVPHVVIRPCAIYGPGDRRLLKLFQMAARGAVPMLGHSRGLYHLIHVEDLAGVVIRSAVHPAARNEVFIAGSQTAVTLTGIVRIIERTLGRRVRIVRVPAWPFFALAAVCETVCRPLRLEPPLYRRRVAFYTKDRAFDTRKLQDVLGYTPLFTDEAGLSQTTRWYLAQGWIHAPFAA